MEAQTTGPMPWPRPFTSRLEKREAILILIYLPLHLFALQWVFGSLVERGTFPEATGNLVYYAVGFVYMVFAAFRFLRRDFDALIDAPLRCVREVLGGYCVMLCFNILLGLLAMLLTGEQNPNNEAVLEVVAQDANTMKAVLVYLAPFVEEMLFRAGIFGLLRRKNRRAAYLVSALCFSFYHVVPYALFAPVYWAFLVQYIPVSLLLARCYERSNSIWCSIFFHMLINGVSLGAAGLMG